MKLKLLAALPLMATLVASPVMAGALGAVATEPRPAAPPVIVAPSSSSLPGGLAGIPAGGVLFGAVLLAAALGSGSSTSTTTTASGS